jgi:hypothetical protein
MIPKIHSERLRGDPTWVKTEILYPLWTLDRVRRDQAFLPRAQTRIAAELKSLQESAVATRNARPSFRTDADVALRVRLDSIVFQ